MKRAALLTITAAFLAGFCWLFPLFHIVPLERAAKEKAAATFDPVRFAEQFWNERLLKSAGQSVKADVLLAAIRNDPAAARKKYSRSVGISESYTYFIAGTGRVLTVSDDEISLAVMMDRSATPEISLQTGLIFGNAVRDGTGLLNVNDYPNSQNFNAISEALNRLVETRVLPKLRQQAKVGAIVRFVGCAEVNDESADLTPLKVVPIRAEIEPEK